MSPKVSVIIPVYNVSEYLGQCLDSVLLQTLQDIEVICVDDGSTDDSLDILQGYAMFDERLKIISQENAGAGAARNNGLKHATGEYIICLDSDDFFEPDMLEKMVAKAEEDDSDVVVCGYCIFDNKTASPVKTVLPILPNNITSPFHPNECQGRLFTFMSPNAWTKLFRIDYIKKENIFFDNTPSSNDLMFVCLALTLAQKISIIYEPFIFYRINTTTQISFNKTKDITPLLTTLNNLWNTLDQKNITNFQDNYFNRLRASLIYELTNRSKNNKVASLTAIRKILPNEVVQNIFSSGNQPAVSIIVPVYNAAPFLPECLDSCLNQTLKEIEIICVDDGSTDNSLEILNEYAQKDNRIKVIHQENQGLPITRNNALKIATGEYIQYLDSDDFLLPKSCECLYLYAKIFDLEMLFFTARDFQNETNETEDIPYHQLSWLPDNFISVFSWQNVKEVMQLVAVTACLTFYKHSFLKEHNIHWINQKICYEDSPYFVEAFLQAQRVGALKENFYQRRLHGKNITQHMDSNFPDYCKVSYLTLKIAKQYADDIAFFRLFHGYTLKSYNIYKELSKQSQQKFKKTLFALYEFLQSFYKLTLHETLQKWYRQNIFLTMDSSRYADLFTINDYKNEITSFYENNVPTPLNLNSPKTYNEKMQWLKLYDSTPLKTRLADKYLVRDWVKEKIGEKYLIPLLGVYDKFEEIDFDKLPNQFVIKCNHGCGWNIIVQDKTKLDLKEVKNKLDKWLNTNFAFQNGMELHYRDIQPKIIIEQFIQNKEAKDLYDYKFWCFNGKVHYIQFLSERSKHLKMTFYDREWNKQNFVYSYPLDDKIVEKPKNLNQMIDLSEKLSKDFSHVRVDFYRLDDGTLYFGEMTFSSASGSCRWNDKNINYLLGSLIQLPESTYDINAKIK